MGSRIIYIINFAPFLHCYTHGIIIFKSGIGCLKGCYKLKLRKEQQTAQLI